MSGRGWKRALAWSAAAHGVLVALLLWRFSPVAPSPVPSEPIELEISSFEVEKPSPEALLDHAQQDIVSPNTATTRPRLSPRDVVANVPATAASTQALPPSDQAAPQPAEGIGLVDRLGSFRGNVGLPGIHMNAPSEKAAPLLGTPQSEPSIAAPKELDLHVVVGRSGVTMHLAEDGSIAGFSDPSSGTHVGLAEYAAIGDKGGGIAPSIMGKFDLTDRLMRAMGQTTYRYEKHRLAEETREERICRMKAAQQRNEREALYRLSGQLEALWNESSPAELKRNLLFALWDECRDEAPDAGAVSALAYQVTIESFIRKHLPQGSALAFTNNELASLNRHRTSTRRFDPYGTPKGMTVPPDAGSNAL
jgi:hypothetical protein